MKEAKNYLNIFFAYIIFLLLLFFENPVLAQSSERNVGDEKIPQKIFVTDMNLTIQKMDSMISNNENPVIKVKALQQKGQLLLQEHQIKEAQKVYEQAMNTRIESVWEIHIKILSGLGEIADLEGNQEKATSYFSEAYTKTKTLKSVTGFLWILYHGGEKHITPEVLSKEQLKFAEQFTSRYLYSKPQLALSASNWLIQYSGTHKKHKESGHMYAGIVYRDWGQFGKALTQFYSAIEVRENGNYKSRSKYGALLNIAAVYDMQGEREKSLKIIKEVAENAEKEGDDWGLAYALKDIGITLMQSGENNAAIPYFLKCIPVMQKLKDVRGEGVCYANLANVYLALKNEAKTEEYITKALQFLELSNYDQLYASTLLVKASLYEKTGKWEKAKAITNKSLVILKRINSLEHIMNAYHVYINYYTHKNNAVMVQKYTDSILEVNKKYYEKSRLYESEKLKVRYETEKKEVQLNIQKKLNTALKEETNLHKKLRNTMFFILLLSVIILVLFLNRYKLQGKLVRQQEKHNELEKKQLEETMNHKQRELTSLTLQMLKKNELLQELEQSIKKLERKSSNDPQKEIRNLKNMLQSQNRLNQDWSNFKIHFDGVHPNFFEKLSQISNLTQQDLRHCSYMKMGLSTKEIAQLMNISASSVQMARYRLKKKLKLNKENDIYNFINNL